MALRKQKVDVGAATFQRLSEASQAVVMAKPPNQLSWRELVKEVGPDLAVEHVETASMIGLVEAIEAVVSLGLEALRVGDSSWDATVDGLKGVQDTSVPRALVIHQAIVACSTCEESATVGQLGLFYLDRMFELVIEILDVDGPDERPSFRSPVERVMWEVSCAAWDAKSGRPNLPLVGDMFA